MADAHLRFSPDAWKSSLLSETEDDLRALKNALRERKASALERMERLCRVSPTAQGTILSELAEQEPALVKGLFTPLTVGERQGVFYHLGGVHQQRILSSIPALQELLSAEHSPLSSEDIQGGASEEVGEVQPALYVPFAEGKEVYSGLLMLPTCSKADWVMIDTHKKQAGRNRVVLFEIEGYSEEDALLLKGRDGKRYRLHEGNFYNTFGGLLSPHQARKVGYTYYLHHEGNAPLLEHYDGQIEGKLPRTLGLRQYQF